MKTINDSDYLYATGRIRVLEGFLLNRDRTARLLDARSDDGIQRILSECGYHADPPKDLHSLELLLTEEWTRVLESMDRMLPDRRLVDIFRVPYDYHNVKSLLKSAFDSADPQMTLLDFGRIPPERLLHLMKDMTLKELPPLLARGIEEAHELMARTSDPQLMDISLDKACIKEILALSRELGDPFVCSYVALTVDAANLKALVRGRRMGKSAVFQYQSLIPGGNVPAEPFRHAISDAAIQAAYSGTVLEKAAAYSTAALHDDAPLYRLDLLCDNALIACLHHARSLAFGVPPAAAYLVAKDFELKTLRLIFSGRFSGIGADKIQERIRDYYV